MTYTNTLKITEHWTERVWRREKQKMDMALLAGVDFKNALRQLRLHFNMSQTKFAEACGVAQPVVSCWERGEHFPTITRIAFMEEIFGLPQGTLLTRLAYELLAIEKAQPETSLLR